MNEIGSWLHTLWLVGLVVLMWAALWCAWKILAWLQPRFWPPARRQERYRMRLRKTRDELRRDRVAEESSVASRLSMEERRAAWAMGSPGGSCLKEGKTVVIPPPLTEEEVEEALNIPAGPSLRLNVRPSIASTAVSPGTEPTPAPMTSTPRTGEGSNSTRQPGPGTSSKNTGGPGLPWSRTTP